MKKRTIALAMTGLLVAAGTVTVLAGTATPANQGPLVGVVANTEVEGADAFMKSAVEDVRDAGYQTRTCKVDESKLVDSCLELVKKNVDVIVAAPGSDEAAIKMVEVAHANGIPVVLQSLGRSDSDYDAIVGQIGEDGGSTAAFCVSELLENN